MNEDDFSGRQRWILTRSSSADFYTISVYSGVGNNRRYLSSTSNGTLVNLWNEIDQSGRQEWSLTQLGDDVYNIEIKGGISNSNKYLSAFSNGSKVDLRSYDDQTGRQQWKIECAGEFELIGVSYYLTPSDVIVDEPSFVSQTVIVNNSPVTQQFAAHFSQKATESSSFTQTQGISLKLSASINVGVPLIIDQKISVETLSSQSWTYGTSQTREDGQSYDFPVNVPAYSTIVTKAIVARHRVSADYEASYRNKINGAIKKVRGRWVGIQASDVIYEITSQTTGNSVTLLQKPQNVVSLNL